MFLPLVPWIPVHVDRMGSTHDGDRRLQQTGLDGIAPAMVLKLDFCFLHYVFFSLTPLDNQLCSSLLPRSIIGCALLSYPAR
jgi:hypothetical protein